MGQQRLRREDAAGSQKITFCYSHCGAEKALNVLVFNVCVIVEISVCSDGGTRVVILMRTVAVYTLSRGGCEQFNFTTIEERCHSLDADFSSHSLKELEIGAERTVAVV
jgi:hypothetical protein